VVAVRGGYESVSAAHRWADVCRALGFGPSQLAAMRMTYERCLLDFEQYVRCGRYTQDVATNAAPQWQQSDRAATVEQVKRAGAAAAAGPPPPAPRQAAARPVMAGGLMGLQGMQLMQGGAAQALALAQIQARLQLQQQAQLLAAQKGGQAPGAQQTMLQQQQQLLLRQLQLQANPQLQALLLQQQQQQAAAAGAAAAGANLAQAQPTSAAPPAAGLTGQGSTNFSSMLDD
jgi:hypothetical protein